MDTVTLSRPSAAADLRVTPQARRVLAYLRKGKSITPMKALVELNISRLASCIHEIRRRAGYTVGVEIDRDEAGHRFARYWLEGDTLA
jgi:hypothetical protein